MGGRNRRGCNVIQRKGGDTKRTYSPKRYRGENFVTAGSARLRRVGEGQVGRREILPSFDKVGGKAGDCQAGGVKRSTSNRSVGRGSRDGESQRERTGNRGGEGEKRVEGGAVDPLLTSLGRRMPRRRPQRPGGGWVGKKKGVRAKRRKATRKGAHLLKLTNTGRGII